MSVKLKFNVKAFEEIRRSPKVLADVESRASRVSAAAGDGFMHSSGQGVSRFSGRARAAVFTATYKAMRRNASDNVLLRALDAGR